MSYHIHTLTSSSVSLSSHSWLLACICCITGTQTTTEELVPYLHSLDMHREKKKVNVHACINWSQLASASVPLCANISARTYVFIPALARTYLHTMKQSIFAVFSPLTNTCCAFHPYSSTYVLHTQASYTGIFVTKVTI